MNQDLTLTLGKLMPELRQPACSETTPKDDAPPEASLKSSPEAADATANSTTNAESTTDAEAVGASAPVGGSGEAVGSRAGRHPVCTTWRGGRRSAAPPRRLYGKNDLPWDFPMAYPHPTLKGIVIVSATNMPHVIKKQVNTE